MMSVLTLVKNREAHLHQLIVGLQRSCTPPAELIVVDMSVKPVCVPQAEFAIRVLRLATDGLPLARARNIAATHAAFDDLLFLDVDCIPGTTLLDTMAQALRDSDALICAEVRYLRGPLPNQWSEEDLFSSGLCHPVRTFPVKGMKREDNAGLFWSLAFGVRRETFHSIGGFDERFTGYGAEDTDFGFRARHHDIALLFLGGACAFHQPHDVFEPPLQHFADIVANARLFRRIWGHWPMLGWLEKFDRMELIQLRDANLLVIRNPTAAEISAARKLDSAF